LKCLTSRAVPTSHHNCLSFKKKKCVQNFSRRS
jgi:hypothetical protein